MSSGPLQRPTGAVPKQSKPTATNRNPNSVPQEMVAPTRRDLQEHLDVSAYMFFQRCLQTV